MTEADVSMITIKYFNHKFISIYLMNLSLGIAQIEMLIGELIHGLYQPCLVY